MSKGSRTRPISISQEELGKNIESIFGTKPKKEQYVPPPLPDDFYKEDKKTVEWQSGKEEK
jgi:hypothetical protein